MNKGKKRWIWLACLLLVCLCLIPAKNTDAASRIRLNRTYVKTKMGCSVKLNLKGISSKKVTWSSSNPSVATVDKGKVEPLKGGNVVITAKAKGRKYRCRITVVGINQTQLTLAPQGTYRLKTKNGKNTKWKSTDPSVVGVSRKGFVRAKKSGKTTIICKTNGRTLKCRVYVPKLSSSRVRIDMGKAYRVTVENVKESVKFTTSNSNVVSVQNDGTLTTVSPGVATVSCKSGKAQLNCEVTVLAPDNIITPMSQLPLSSHVDRQLVTINGYLGTRTYTIYNQAGKVNKTSGKNTVKESYMPGHGCGACALSTVLSGYAGMTAGPVYTTETIEKKIFGATVWKKNYTSKQMPVSLYGISKVLNYYKIPNTYVRYFPGAMGTNGKIVDNKTSDALAIRQIEKHLKTGNPVVIEVSKTNRTTKKEDKLWANSYHTMVLLGMTENGKVIVADSANRSGFDNTQRIKYASLKDLIPYMFSSTNLTSSYCQEPYWVSRTYCGGYLLVNPQPTE